MLNRPSARVALAVVLALASYAWWVSDQYSRLNDLNQLELQDAGAELKRVTENAVETIAKFKPERGKANSQTANEVCVFDDQQPYLEFVGECQGMPWNTGTPRCPPTRVFTSWRSG